MSGPSTPSSGSNTGGSNTGGSSKGGSSKGGRPDWSTGSGGAGGRPPRTPAASGPDDQGDENSSSGGDRTNETPPGSAGGTAPNKPFGQRPNYGRGGSQPGAAGGGKPGAVRQLADVAKKTARENAGKDDAGIGKKEMANIARGDGSPGGRRRAATKAAVNYGRKYLAGATGGVSEGVIAGLRVAKIVLPILLTFSLLLGLGLVAVIAGGGGSLSNQISYSLDAGAADAIPADYLAAYQAAGDQYNVPWTVLAGVGRVASNQGRSAPSDITDYGKRIDRSPGSGPNDLVGGGAGVSGSSATNLPVGAAVSVLGDSLVGGTQSLFSAGLSGHKVTVDSRPGWEIGALTPVAAKAVADGAKYVVVSAGTNDVWGLTGSRASTETARARIDTMLNTLKPAYTEHGCALWVNVQDSTGSGYISMRATATSYNRVLAEEAAKHPWVTIVNWASVASGTGGSVNAPDGLHLSASGQSLYVSTILSALAGCSTTAGTVQGSGVGAVSSVPVATDPSWTNCGGSDCVVNPVIGSKPGEAQGPLLLTSSWLSQNSDGMNPQSINDAAMLLAKSLSDIRDGLVAADTTNQYSDYQNDPVQADALWTAAVGQAPVDLPSSAGVNVQACSATATPAPSANWVWPISDGTKAPMTRTFASTSTTLGVDLAAPAGTPVVAAGDGTVLEVGNEVGGAGHYVKINHGAGYITLYAHLASVRVKSGATVTSGATIGTVGSSGHTKNGAVLYFALTNNGVPTDPATVLGAYSGKATSGSNLANDADINSGSAFTSAVMGAGTTGGQAVNPCTGSPLVPSTQSVQTAVDGSGCPTTAYANTVRYTKMTIEKICRDSVAKARDSVTAKAIIAAFNHLGMIYSQPKRNLPGYSDCSSYVSRMYEVAGVNMAPPGTNAPTTLVIRDARWSQEISASEARPGDLEETGDFGHVTMVLADGFIAENSGDGDFSHVDPDWITGGHFYRIIVSRVPGTAPDVTADSSPFTPSTSGTVNGSGGAVDGSTASRVVQYAIYFGGDYVGDDRAGTFVTTSPTGTTTSSNNEVVSMIYQAWPQAQWKNAEAVATCESNMNPLAEGTNTNGTHDMGVFQLNDGGTLQGLLKRLGQASTNTTLAFDANWNIRAAYQLFKERGWQPWSCAHHLKIVVQNSAGNWVPGPGSSTA